MCEDPPTVDNSKIYKVKRETLMSGETTLSIYKYGCNYNYYIDDKSKRVVSCQSGSASWNYTTLPVCLKGLFCINPKSTKFLNIYIF